MEKNMINIKEIMTENHKQYQENYGTDDGGMMDLKSYVNYEMYNDISSFDNFFDTAYDELDTNQQAKRIKHIINIFK